MNRSKRPWFHCWTAVVVCALLAGGLTFWLLWSWSVPRPRLTLTAPVEQTVAGFSADRNKVLTLSLRVVDTANGPQDRFSGPLRVWDLRTGEERSFAVDGDTPDGRTRRSELGATGLVQEKDQSISGIRFAPDGQSAVFNYSGASDEGETTLRLYSFRQGRELRRWVNGATDEATYSPDGQWLIFSWQPVPDGPAKVQLVRATTGEEYTLGERDYLASGRFSSDSRYFAYIEDIPGEAEQRDSRLVVHDLDQQRVLWRQPGWKQDEVLGFSPDGRTLAAVRNYEITLLEAGTGEPRLKLQNQKSLNSLDIVFAPDDRTLILYGTPAFSSGTSIPFSRRPRILIGLWNADTGQMIREFKSPEQLLQGFDDPPAEQLRYALPAGKGSWKLMDHGTGAELGTWSNDYHPMWSSSDGKLLMTHNWQDVQPSVLRTYLAKIVPGIQAPDPVQRSNWRIWDVATRRELACIQGAPEDMRRMLEFELGIVTADGKTLATYSPFRTSMISIWDLPPHTPILRPLAWSLLVSLFVTLLGCWFVTRKRRRPPLENWSRQ